ncbi:hypothetical protein FB567DRAFT_630084 [Paraphoma chrysanthemicola]|uniref:SET domain-containing protein n=1 Tax=Paraphoma chrysanthemicola TaxID=798071 RepID=A0A8K0R1B7_9PLEO|nr:hypothetical protein FB567DRAFT_630084 [Paraphoma chrysanthemicola]
MKGTLILQENPLVECKTNIGKTIWKANPAAFFFASERAGTTSKLSSAINTLSPMDRASFNRLFTPAGPGNAMVQMVDRFEYNAFHFFGSSHKRHLVLFRIACYINHSCIPNATVDIGQDISQYPRGQIRLVATQNIARDSEIFFNYIADDWKNTSVLRGNVLQEHWHFACLCTGCAPLQAPLDTIERQMAVAYSNNLPDPAVLPALPEIARHIDRMGTYIHLLGTLGIWDDKLSYACMLLAILHESKSD